MKYIEYCHAFQGCETRRFSDFSYHQSKEWYFDFTWDAHGSNALFIRHDVDRDPETALKMARIESRLGIVANYFFLLNPDSGINGLYFPAAPQQTLELMRSIQDLGHEVGLHYDLLGNFFENGHSPRQNLSNQLEVLRSNGLMIQGCASHGSQFVYNHTPQAKKDCTYPPSHSNYQVFREFSQCSDETVSLGGSTLVVPCLRFFDYGLSYEVYHVKKDAYLTDGGRTFFHYNRDSTILPVPGLRRGSILENPLDLLCESGGKVVQFLLHPAHWRGNLH